MERQFHGFEQEAKYIEKVEALKLGYTNNFDCIEKDGIPAKIKTIKKGSSIDMADIFINANESINFYLIVFFWNDRKDNIVESYKIFIEIDKWKELFKFSLYKEMKEWIHSVSNDSSYDIKWENECSYFKKEWNKTKRYIQPRFKRDHKKQKRIQCAINNRDFYNYFLREFEYCQVNME